MSASGYTAILLAAGQGLRIVGTTPEPKVLLDLYGRSLLERHLEAWAAVGIEHATLVVGYKQHLIRNAVDLIDTPVKIRWVDNTEYASKGNTHSMLLGLRAAPEKAVVFDADLVYGPDILQRFIDAPIGNAILVGIGHLNDIESVKTFVDKDDCVRMIFKREITAKELELCRFVGEATGVLKFDSTTRAELVGETKRFLSIPGNATLNWEHFFDRFLIDHDVVCHFEPSDQWVEIDTPEDYALALEKFAPQDEEA